MMEKDLKVLDKLENLLQYLYPKNNYVLLKWRSVQGKIAVNSARTLFVYLVCYLTKKNITSTLV